MAIEKPFRILSIDGGGIRGVFPAKFLLHIESELQRRGNNKTKLYQHFDLICGTSTGGIIALGLSLGLSAKEILDLYLNNANKIFGGKKSLFTRLHRSAHDRVGLEDVVRNKFKEAFNGIDPRLNDARTNLCIPIYDLSNGTASVLKTKHHESYNRDYHIPAYQVALATSAAPTFFDPYSANYINLNGVEVAFNNKVDGGIVSNNPTLVGIIEAQKAFKKSLPELKILSIGTGHQKYSDAANRSKWGIIYWMLKNNKQRLIDLFMQAQSQQINHLINLLHVGIDKSENENFTYTRVDIELTESTNIALDETDPDKLSRLVALADREFQIEGNSIYTKHFQ